MPKPSNPASKFGRIKFEGKDLPPQPATYNRIAIGQKGELLFVSLVAEANFVKAIRSILSPQGTRATIYASGGQVKAPGDRYAQAADPGKVLKVDEGYETWTHKLEHGLVHACFVARQPGFMLSVTDESLCAQLKDIRYTTPFLDSWVPYIKDQMIKGGILAMARCMACECGTLNATETQFDFIISNGLKTKALIIPEGQHAKA